MIYYLRIAPTRSPKPPDGHPPTCYKMLNLCTPSGSGSAGGIIGDLVVSLRPGRTPFVGLKWWIGVGYVDRASASGTPPPVAGVQAIREFVIAVLRHV